MNLTKSKNANVNYLAQIVDIKDFSSHINPKVERLKVAHVQGYDILVGIDEQPGKYVYFPTNSMINPALLSFANLYRHAELNANSERTGFFEDNGRVKAICLQKQVSEGFLLPFAALQAFILSSVNVALDEKDCPDGLEFDQAEHGGKAFWINRKYVIRNNNQRQNAGNPGDRRARKRNKRIAKLDVVIENQFRFHYDTVLLRKNPNVIAPNDLISITSKWHGCVAKDTMIVTKEYGKMTIGEIVEKKLQCHILAYDPETNEMIYAPIGDWYLLKDDGEWYEIELEDGTKIQITGNNPVWLPELNAYRKVEDLTGDEVLLVN